MYSKYKPMIRIIRKNKAIIMEGVGGGDPRGTRGIKRAISMSKIKKINVIRKNWILKG